MTTYERHTGLRFQVNEYLKSLPAGRNFGVREIARAVHAQSDSVSSALGKLIRLDDARTCKIERIANGWYKILSQPADEAITETTVTETVNGFEHEGESDVALFELLGRDLKGSLLVKNEAGRVYRLVEL